MTNELVWRKADHVTLPVSGCAHPNLRISNTRDPTAPVSTVHGIEVFLQYFDSHGYEAQMTIPSFQTPYRRVFLCHPGRRTIISCLEFHHLPFGPASHMTFPIKFFASVLAHL